MFFQVFRPLLDAVWFRATRAGDAERGRVARQALEPIHCAVALSLLSAMPGGSKISIRDHEVAVQPHSAIQGYNRSRNGDKHEDLTMLRRPLKAVACIYASSSGERKFLIGNIMAFAVKGLERLVQTYQAMSRNDATLITKFKAVRDLAELYATYITVNAVGETEPPANPPSEEECAYTSSLLVEFADVWTNKDLQEVVTLLQLADSIETPERKDAAVVPVQMMLNEKLSNITEIITLYQRGGEE